MEQSVHALEQRIHRVCGPQARYQVLWLVGAPRSGKTRLARTVCQRYGWRYINFTLDTEYLDSLIGHEETYRPADFIATLRTICAEATQEIIVIDEIEPLLGWWDWNWQEVFFKEVGRATRLSAGVVLTTRLRTPQQLLRLVPNADHVFDISQGEEL
ncbi:MAG: AAA family ATPase [Ardenticatenaceae bacterium]